VSVSRIREKGVDRLLEPVLNAVETAEQRVSCRDLVYNLSRRGKETPRLVRAAVKRLVAKGELRYVTESGMSFLEKNYAGRVRLSRRVVVVPPRGCAEDMDPGCVPIRLLPGIAFGDCRHPSTRISVRAIDFLIDMCSAKQGGLSTAIDIGTGSGILALVAARLGIKHVLAIDIDPCARVEAANNVVLNRLESRIEVSGKGLDEIEDKASLVIANLRLPTLKRSAAHIFRLLEPGGAVVLSGVRQQEAGALADCYRPVGGCVWKEVEKGWCGMVFAANPPERS